MASDDSIIIWRNLHEIADKVCRQFGLSYGRIEPETNPRAHRQGHIDPCDRCCTKEANGNGIDVANCTEKIIKIRIHQIHHPNRPLALSTVVDTLAHELAHLRPSCWNHGREHDNFRREILAFIREIGYTW